MQEKAFDKIQHPFMLSFLKVLINSLHQIWEVLSHYIFKIFFLPFFSSPYETSVMCMLVCLMMSHRSSRLSTFFLILFTFCFSDWAISVDDVSSSSLFFPLPSQICWALLVGFLFQLFTSQLQNSHILFNNFYFFVNIFYLVKGCPHPL